MISTYSSVRPADALGRGVLAASGLVPQDELVTAVEEALTFCLM